MALTKIQSLGITDGTIVNADINASAAIAGTKLTGAGKVLQIVSTTTTLSFSSSSGTFVTTGLTASITPSLSSSKILIIVTAPMSTQTSNLSLQNAIYRGGSSVLTFNGNYGATAGWLLTNNSAHYLDSPATTSSTTYTLYSRVSAGAGTISASDPSTITLMEITY